MTCIFLKKNKIAKGIFAFLFFWGRITTAITAQSNNHEIILQLQPAVKIENFLAEQNEYAHADWKIKRCIALEWNTWMIENLDSIEIKKLIARCEKSAKIVGIQKNIRIDFRNTMPNDAVFASQWHLKNTGQTGGKIGADIHATQAWDITTGGKTIYGDDIVIALIDDGITLTNTDWGSNIWQNPNEIPNNGFDDDGNGFVDDINGWSFKDSTNNIGNGVHGTEVGGVMAAMGNNSFGIAGINWRVKLMTLKISGTLDQVLSAYYYVFKMRKLYNDTNGKRGAFIVASNSSFGTSGFAVSQTLWCSAYDSLGSVGVLNFGATDNSEKNVDIAGDIPSTCPSDYLVVVTSTNANDVKGNARAYGPINVDVAAPGENIFTLQGNSYGSISGTSLACPIGTGIAALAYAVPCPTLMDSARANPAAAALFLKKTILESVDKIDTLQKLILTGGRVNAFKTLKSLTSTCTNSAVVIFQNEKNEAKLFPNPTNSTVDFYFDTPIQITQWQLFDVQGKRLAEEFFTAPRSKGSIDLQNLPNGIYFVQLRSREKIYFVKIVKI